MIFDYRDSAEFLDGTLKCQFEVIEPKVNRLRVEKVDTEQKVVTMRKLRGVDVTDVRHFETPTGSILANLGNDEITDDGSLVYFDVPADQIKLRFYGAYKTPKFDITFL